MLLHLGENTVVRLRDVIGVFDMENTTLSLHTRRFLADAEKGGRIVTASPEMPKSFVVCQEKDGTEMVYLSQLSCATLRGRIYKGG